MSQKTKVMLSFEIIEEYSDSPSEPFGHELLDHLPEPGEKLMLHWLDGTCAYMVKVLRVDDELMRLRVERVLW